MRFGRSVTIKRILWWWLSSITVRVAVNCCQVSLLLLVYCTKIWNAATWTDCVHRQYILAHQLNKKLTHCMYHVSGMSCRDRACVFFYTIYSSLFFRVWPTVQWSRICEQLEIINNSETEELSTETWTKGYCTCNILMSIMHKTRK